MPMPAGQHEHYNVYLLQRPARHGTPFQFVELDWNPSGHGYPYTAPHFDFHFYRTTRSGRDAIVPTDPQWMAKAAAGTWDGRVIFDEPLVTREFIMAQRESAEGGVSIRVPLAQRYAPAGYYPNGYRVGYDAQAREYRIALIGLAWRN